MAYLQWRKRSISSWEPTAYATNQIATVFNVSVTDLVGAAFIRVTEAFDGTGTAATMGVGDGGARARFITTANADAANTGVKIGTALATSPGYLYTSSDTIDLNYCEASNGDTLTGIVDVWVYIAHGVPYA